MIVSFYDPKTGLFTGGTFTGASPERNTPSGLKAIPGRFDPRMHRVDLETGSVVEYQALPDPVADVRERRRKARRHIALLERRVIRAMRELLIDPNNSEARDRLQAIEAEIEGLRHQLLVS